MCLYSRSFSEHIVWKIAQAKMLLPHTLFLFLWYIIRFTLARCKNCLLLSYMYHPNYTLLVWIEFEDDHLIYGGKLWEEDFENNVFVRTRHFKLANVYICKEKAPQNITWLSCYVVLHYMYLNTPKIKMVTSDARHRIYLKSNVDDR